MGESLGSFDRPGDTAADMAVRFAPKVFAAAAIRVAGYLAGRWAGRFAGRAAARFHLDPPVRTLLQRIVHLLVVGLFLIAALQNLGIELLPLIAGLGVAGAGIALAMQEVLAGSARVLKEPAAGTSVARFSDTGVVLGAWPWVAASDYVDVPGELNEAILAALRAQRIAIAVPRREIRTVATAALRGEAAGRSAA